MANYCYNSLEIIGSEENIKRFEEFIKEGDKGSSNEWDLTKIVPVETDEEGYYKNVDIYKEWGTKWIADVYFKNHGNSATLSFDTAWSPSLPITLKISKKFNLRVNHFYEESGCDFEGNYDVDNGVVILDDERTYRPNCVDCGEKFDRDEMIYNEEEGEHYCFSCSDNLARLLAEKIEKIKDNKKNK